jgi:hypothetical protein
MRFLLFISILVVVIHILKLVWLWFKPGFLKRLGFDRPETPLMLTAYYLLSVLVLAAFIADELGYLRFISVR